MVPMFRVFCLSRFLTCVTIAETRLQKLLQNIFVRACYGPSLNDATTTDPPSPLSKTHLHCQRPCTKAKQTSLPLLHSAELIASRERESREESK